MATKAIARRGGKGLYPKGSVVQQKSGSKRSLPEYLLPEEVAALIHAALHGQARLLFLILWRAGLRVGEAVSLAVEDLQLEGEQPTLRVRQGKGGKDRQVPCHAELAAAFRQVIDFGNVRRGTLVATTRSTAWRWIKDALARAQERGTISAGRRVGTHTLRHSAARHWLASGVPINVVSRWLGHASIQTTLIYLEILPDPSGYMERVE